MTQPNADDISLTRRNPEMEKYAIIRGKGDDCTVHLSVGNQSFCVTPYGCDGAEGAVWTRDMLCTALARLVEAEIKART